MCREIYRFFVHGEIDAATETNVIEPLAEIFRNNAAAPDQMRIVMEALLTSDHFFSAGGARLHDHEPRGPGSWATSAGSMHAHAHGGAVRGAADRVADTYYLIAYCGQRSWQPAQRGRLAGLLPVPALRRHLAGHRHLPGAEQQRCSAILYTGFSTPANLTSPSAPTSNSRWTWSPGGPVHRPEQPQQRWWTPPSCYFPIPVPISRPCAPAQDELPPAGPLSDSYWSDAYELYVADPNTTDMTAQLVPTMLLWLFLDMAKRRRDPDPLNRHTLTHATQELPPLIGSGHHRRVHGARLQQPPMQAPLEEPCAEDRVLVIVQLYGGNDGLNTVIPLDQYSVLSSQAALRADPLRAGAAASRLGRNRFAPCHDRHAASSGRMASWPSCRAWAIPSRTIRTSAPRTSMRPAPTPIRS
jgi:hypothetical protein